MTNDDEVEQENHTLREGLKQALMAIDFLQERIKDLEGRQAKDSHNRSLPPSSGRFVRAPKSGKKPAADLVGSSRSPGFLNPPEELPWRKEERKK